MSKLFFAKFEGAGNDFILVDDRSGAFSHDVVALCARKTGVGADGVILLQHDAKADFQMRIFNSDGGEAESCGNGLRCLGAFLLELGLPRKPYHIAMHNKIVRLEYFDDAIGVAMGRPADLRAGISTEFGEVHYVDTGVPHIVHFVDDVRAVDLAALGPKLRHHKLFQPRGANVNVVTRAADGILHVRTFERGVEAETLACGTGACAVAVVAHAVSQAPSPMEVQFPGGRLRILWDGHELLMIGPAKKVFEGLVF